MLGTEGSVKLFKPTLERDSVKSNRIQTIIKHFNKEKHRNRKEIMYFWKTDFVICCLLEV